MGRAFNLWLRLFTAAGTIVQSLGFSDRGPHAKQLVDATPEIDALVHAEFRRSLEASEGAPVSASRVAHAARQQVIELSFARGTEGRVAVTMTFLRSGQSEWRIGAIPDAALPESVKRVLDGGPPSTAFRPLWVWQPATA